MLPKVVNYRDYKNFDNKKVRVDVPEFSFIPSNQKPFLTWKNTEYNEILVESY